MSDVSVAVLIVRRRQVDDHDFRIVLVEVLPKVGDATPQIGKRTAKQTLSTKSPLRRKISAHNLGDVYTSTLAHRAGGSCQSH
jgi:hypothetical protein